MPEYRICPNCGASLDPGERCDCTKTIPGAAAVRDGKAGAPPDADSHGAKSGRNCKAGDSTG